MFWAVSGYKNPITETHNIDEVLSVLREWLNIYTPISLQNMKTKILTYLLLLSFWMVFGHPNTPTDDDAGATSVFLMGTGRRRMDPKVIEAMEQCRNKSYVILN